MKTKFITLSAVLLIGLTTGCGKSDTTPMYSAPNAGETASETTSGCSCYHGACCKSDDCENAYLLELTVSNAE